MSTIKAGTGDGSKRQINRQSLPWWLWLLKHSQAIVTAGMTVGVIYYHNSESIYLTCTALITSFMAKGLKKVIKQPRPKGSIVQTPGMPSTHSATGTYIALYLAFLLVRKDDPQQQIQPQWMATIAKPILIPTLLTFPALMIYSRVRLGVHTLEQCLAGAFLGCTTTLFFSTIWSGWSSFSGLASLPIVHQTDHWIHQTFLKLFGGLINSS